MRSGMEYNLYNPVMEGHVSTPDENKSQNCKTGLTRCDKWLIVYYLLKLGGFVHFNLTVGIFNLSLEIAIM